MNLPEPKHSVTVTLSGHTLESVIAGLTEVQNELLQGVVGDKCHNTPEIAWHITHEVNEAMTPEEYEAGFADFIRQLAESI